MKGVNKVILIGNLGAEPKVNKSSESGSVTRIAIATSKSWKDKKTGNLEKKVQWHNVVFFGNLADIALNSI